jgi:hypothetical protein
MMFSKGSCVDPDSVVSVWCKSYTRAKSEAYTATG